MLSGTGFELARKRRVYACRGGGWYKEIQTSSYIRFQNKSGLRRPCLGALPMASRQAQSLQRRSSLQQTGFVVVFVAAHCCRRCFFFLLAAAFIRLFEIAVARRRIAAPEPLTTSAAAAVAAAVSAGAVVTAFLPRPSRPVAEGSRGLETRAGCGVVALPPTPPAWAGVTFPQGR